MELTQHPFIRELLSLHLDPGEYVVAGSGPLLAHGLRREIGDLDVVARGEAWKRVVSLVGTVPAPSGHGRMALLFDGDIEVFDRWLPISPETDELIDSAEIIQGVPFCPLPLVLAWKQRSNREKDEADVKLIKEHLAQAEGNGPSR
ncbi:hypothetical protein ACFQ7O_10155 [Streptomyces sp. NPDC056485]|uniref:hypothetical protein n=1 Tax=Streptomyces sp. NPDC056485 TaxID=3345834 RepID=UPI0036956F63